MLAVILRDKLVITRCTEILHVSRHGIKLVGKTCPVLTTWLYPDFSQTRLITNRIFGGAIDPIWSTVR